MRRLKLRESRPGARISAGVGLFLFLAFAAPAAAQQPPPAAPPPGPGPGPAANAKPAGPLARYVARDGLILYAELDGLDAHADVWKKTAAYKILNETPTGALMEDLTTQLLDKIPLGGQPAGADILTAIEHIFRSGAVLALNHDEAGGPKAPVRGVAVLRGAARKDVRALFGRLMWLLMGPDAKPQTVAKGTRRVVQVARARGGNWIWWAEKEDLVFALGGDKDVDAIIETIDGKRTNAVGHALRAELTAEDGGFRPILAAFADAGTAPTAGQMGQFFAKLKEAGVSRFDYRWGFQDKALMSVTRLAAPKPRQGLLALFDQPTFGLKDLPPLPKGIDDFAVVSAEPAKVYDRLIEQLKSSGSPTAEKLEAFEQALKEESRLDLRDDVLARLGPKMAYYLAPEEKPSAAKAAASAATAVLPAALRGLLEAVPKVPRFALVVEVADREKFARAFKELMFAANRQFKSSLAVMAKEEKEAAKDEKGSAGSNGERKKEKPKPLVVEFRLTTPEPHLTYELSMPAAVSQLIGGVRPVLILGKKYLIVASARDLARQAVALEGKSEGRWTPTDEQSAALGQLGANLMFLSLSDPRETLPQAIVDLPRSLDQALAGALPAGAGGGSPPQAPGGNGTAPALFKVDPAKIPSADAIKKLLFPGEAAVAVDDKEVRVTTHAAFPNIGTASSGASVQKLLPMLGISPPGLPGLPAMPTPPGGAPNGAGPQAEAGGASAAPSTPAAPPGGAGSPGRGPRRGGRGVGPE